MSETRIAVIMRMKAKGKFKDLDHFENHIEDINTQVLGYGFQAQFLDGQGFIDMFLHDMNSSEFEGSVISTRRIERLQKYVADIFEPKLLKALDEPRIIVTQWYDGGDMPIFWNEFEGGKYE